MSIPDKLDHLQEILKGKSTNDTDLSDFFDELKSDIAEHERQLEILTIAGAELNKEQDQRSALVLILYSARHLTNADAGTVYSVQYDYYNDPFDPGKLKSKSLVFEEMHTESKNLFISRPDAPPVDMEINGEPNYKNVAAYCANTGQILNIPDVYDDEKFDFSGPKKYDKLNNYRSKSMLVLPLKNHENEINGVLQLINRRNEAGDVVPFTKNDQTIVQAMSYQAAISLTTQQLLHEQIRLFDSFVKVLAEGLGEKSPYTYGHIDRVSGLSLSIADKISSWSKGMYKGITFDKNQMEEIHLAGWMHDIGKLTTPEHVVSKSLKLTTIFDRFEMIIERFNSKIKDLEIEALNEKLDAIEKGAPKSELAEIEQAKRKKIDLLIGDLQILNRSNFGTEKLDEKDCKVIDESSNQTVQQYIEAHRKVILGESQITNVSLLPAPREGALVSEEEKEYLSISRGTLSNAERKQISDHADRSWRWLMRLPFPRKRIKLPLFAGAHHETLNGKGYPNKLTAEQLPIQSRIIAVADIFEALTANDRPYKESMTLGKALSILGSMVKNGELDAEIVKIFLKSGLFKEYAKSHLTASQIEEIDVEQWLRDYYPSDFKNSLPEQ